MIKDFGKELGVTEDTVINWEKRGRKPSKKHLGRLNRFIDGVEEWLEP